jgi:hypothetical protein
MTCPRLDRRVLIGSGMVAAAIVVVALVVILSGGDGRARRGW